MIRDFTQNVFHAETVNDSWEKKMTMSFLSDIDLHGITCCTKFVCIIMSCKYMFNH